MVIGDNTLPICRGTTSASVLSPQFGPYLAFKSSMDRRLLRGSVESLVLRYSIRGVFSFCQRAMSREKCSMQASRTSITVGNQFDRIASPFAGWQM